MRSFKGKKFRPENNRYDREDAPQRPFTREKQDYRPKKERSFRDNIPRRNGPESTYVTCAKCGTRCSVPFKPTGDKPVYCRDCFKKPNERSGEFSREKSQPEIRVEELDQINEKLDKIMRHLKIK